MSSDDELEKLLVDVYESLAKSQKPLDVTLSQEELFDCYAKSSPE